MPGRLKNRRGRASVRDVTVPLPELVLVALVVFAGYLVFGVTGFGASPITIPVLVHVLPLTFVLALAAILDLASALALGLRTRRRADARELAVLVPFTLVGLALGVTLLVRLPRGATQLALGLFVCAFALHVIVRRDVVRRLGRRWAAPAGIVGALFGMGGPPYVMYIAARVAEPAAQRATIAQMVILSVGLRVAAFALAGLLASPGLWIAVAALLPVAWAGVWVGHRVHLRLAPATTARLIGGALLVSGAALILRTV